MAEAFAHPDYLADPQWLIQHRQDHNLVIIDVDSEAGYLRGHIPGARRLADDYERDPSDGWVRTLPPEQFARVCQRLNIGDASRVVVYDNNRSLYAARFWWVLNFYGHQDVRVLDGGWRGWVTSGGGVSFDPAPAVSDSIVFTPRMEPSFRADLADVKSACALGDAIIWDTRSQPEYTGQEKRGHQHQGHIAGAVHLDWRDLMDRETHRFKSPSELSELLARAGIAPDKPVYAY